MCAVRAHLLDVTQGIDELLDQPEVRAQPPEQEKQQQGYQGNNYQILQITFSAVLGTLMPWEVCDQYRVGRCLAVLAPFAALFSRIGQIIFATARKRIDVTPPRRRGISASINATRRETASMNCFGQNSSNLLGKGAMLGRRATTKGLFQFTGDVSADEHSFAIDHWFSGAPCEKVSSTVNDGRFRTGRKRRQKCEARAPAFSIYICQTKRASL